LRFLDGKIANQLRKASWKCKRIAWSVKRAWPNASIHLIRDRGLGDVLMCTPTLRVLKRKYPRSRIHFYTDLPDVVRGLSYIDRVLPVAERPALAVYMTYKQIGQVIPQPKHLATIMGEALAVAVDDVRPDCVVSAEIVERFSNEWRHLPRPHVLVQRRAGPWTPNKNWPDEYWQKLIRSLSQTATVIEIGDSPQDGSSPDLRNYLDLRGKTTVAELAACVAASDVLVAPVSGPVHIAAAVNTPSVVILGGYERPENTEYARNKVFYTPLNCSPCWLRTPCPIYRECLTQISPEAVEQAVIELWAARTQEPAP
jgi:ADP-heptose:LPS heptosyltransferase